MFPSLIARQCWCVGCEDFESREEDGWKGVQDELLERFVGEGAKVG